MSDTSGCTAEHASIALPYRVALAMAADQGEELWEWAGR